MNLIHSSPRPLSVDLLLRPQSNRESTKPRGLWVSDGEAWAEWCLGRGHNLHRLAHNYRVILRPSAELLIIDTAEKFDEFVELHRSRSKIRWDRVDALHDGIVISPYRADREGDWYSLWNCASGCIWNTSAIEDLVEITLG